MRVIRLALGGVFLFALAVAVAPARAQSINIDFGVDGGVPPDTYGGAAGQPGRWNGIQDLNEPAKLVGVDGLPTSAVISACLPYGSALGENDRVSAEHAPLILDYLDLHSVPCDFTIEGLVSGSYLVYTYAWAPDSPFYKTFVTVNGKDTQRIGGGWSGSPHLMFNYALHDERLDPGEPLVVHTFGLPKGTLNGFQIVKLR